MYGGQPPPHPHQLQHAQQPFDAPGGMPVEPHAQPVMDPSDFNAFQDGIYGFQTIHDPSAMMGLPNQPGAGPGHYTGDVNQHMASTQLSSEAMGAMGVSASVMDPGQGSQEPDHIPQQDRKPSLGPDALDETGNDDFDASSSNRADGTDLGGKSKDSNKADATPSWSELKTKAGKDRKRLPLACIACRRKKIRCSGEKPACKHCLRSRIPCVYKVTTRKAAPRTDYMAMLDKRLKRMEERIIKVIPKSDQGPTSTVTRAVVKPAIPGSLSGGKPAPKKRGADEAFGPGLEAWANTPAKTGTQGEAAPPSPGAEDSEESQLLKEGADALPPIDIQEHLSEVYFDNVYGQAYHLLHKPSYMRKLKKNDLPPVLILTVCAVAARFSTNPKLNSDAKLFLRGEEWAAPAREICTKRYESPNITILTCLLILGLHEFGTCQGSRSWALGGQAIRMAFALQLHKDLDRDPLSRNSDAKLTFIDREIRRRIMWSCFIMDRFNSSGSERPMFIKENIVNIPLPVRERHFQLDMEAVTENLSGTVPHRTETELDSAGDARDNLGVAGLMIRSIALWGRIMAYINQGGRDSEPQPLWNAKSGFSQLSQEADEFLATLPEPLVYSADNLTLHKSHCTTNQFILLHIVSQQNILFLSRAALVPIKGKPNDFSSSNRARAFAAANKISEYLRDAEDSRVSLTAPFAGYCAFSSTMMHISGIVSGDPAAKAAAEANATTNIRFLRKMMKYWGMFHWMEEDIRSHFRTALDRSRAGASPEDPTMTSPILQYGDWFNRYPNGVSHADFTDPTSKNKDRGADGVLEQKPELQSVEEFFTSLASPKAVEQPKASQPSKPKRKAVKKGDAAPAKPLQQAQQPPALDTATATQRRTSVQDQQITPSTRQPQQRRPSAPITGPVNSPATFHPLTTSHPQPSAYHSISPISPVNVEQFHQASQGQPGQPGFYQANMMHMNMGQQPNTMMQPINHQMSFGGYSIDASHMPQGQQMMGGAPGWHNVGGNAPDGQQAQNHVPGQGMPMTQHPQTHGPDQNGPNGMNGDGWFMPFNMQHANSDPNMSVQPNNTDGFNGMFNGNGNGMPAQNPLGGLRHAQ